MSKGETLIDTAVTLNAMKPDLLVVRHSASGAAALLSQKVGCSVINAGDGWHEHPTQALLDALTLRRAFGVQCEFLLLDGGSMLADYEAVAPVTVVTSDRQLRTRLAGLAARGSR